MAAPTVALITDMTVEEHPDQPVPPEHVQFVDIPTDYAYLDLLAEIPGDPCTLSVTLNDFWQGVMDVTHVEGLGSLHRAWAPWSSKVVVHVHDTSRPIPFGSRFRLYGHR